MITAFNRILATVIDAAVKPAMAWSDRLALVAAALFLALIGLLVFRFCSNQAALRRSRNVMLARLLEFRLFGDNLPGVFGTLGRTLRAGALYLGQTARPVAVLIVPFGLLLVHLSAWFEVRPLQAGEEALFTVGMARNAGHGDLKIVASDGVEVRTAGFVAPAADEVVWRIAAMNDGEREWVDVTHGDARERKTVAVSPRIERVEVARVAGPFWDRFAHPGEPPLPADGPFRFLRVDYPRREISCCGRRVHWLAALTILTIAFGFVLRIPLRVEL